MTTNPPRDKANRHIEMPPVMEALEDRLLLASGHPVAMAKPGPAGYTAAGIILHKIVAHALVQIHKVAPPGPVNTDPTDPVDPVDPVDPIDPPQPPPNRTPIVDVIADKAVTVGQPISFTVTGSDPDGDALTWSATGLPNGATFDAATQVFTWSPTTAGVYTVTFTASDGKASASATVKIVVAPPPNRAPVVDAIADKAVTIGQPISFTVTGSDPDGDTLTWSATGLPSGATFNTATQVFAWTPTAVGTFTVIFTASDGKASANAAVKIVVSPPPNRTPIVNAIADKSATVGQALSFTVTGYDPDGDALAWSAAGLPSGAVFNAATQTFVWTPTAAGTYTVTFTASDGKANASASAKIVVTKPADPIGPPTINDTGIGQGAINAYYIDRDGDGYGVGSPLGPDADDSDPTVNTFASALAKHGSVTALLNHLGYDPLRIFYISPVGSDTAGTIDDLNKPFKTYSAIVKQLRPGDAVIFRAGTYTATSDAHLISVNNLHGTATNPIVIMGMPGEKVVLDTAIYDKASIYATNSSYIIFDNFVCTTSTTPGQGRGINLTFCHHLTFRNIETMRHFWGVIGMQDLHDLVFDNIVSHDNPGEHGMYLGAREYPNSNIVVQNSLFYNNHWQGIQINGRGDNYVLVNNIIHSNAQIGIQLIQGVCNSTIANNLIFNNAKSPIVFYMYDSSDPNIAPHRQDNNLVINNTIWTGPDSNLENNPSQMASILFSDTTAKGNYSMNNNVFRNNIFYSYGGEIFKFNSSNAIATTVIENNLFYRELGDSKVMTLQGVAYSMSAFRSFSPLFKNNLYANPLFADVNRSYHATPEKFNFRLLPGSPAIGAGSSTGAPKHDLRYTPRQGPIDIGAYVYVV